MANTLASLKHFLGNRYVVLLARIIFWCCLLLIAGGLLTLVVVNVLFEGVDAFVDALHSNVALLIVAIVLSGAFLLATAATYVAAAALVGGAVVGLALAWVDVVKQPLRVLYVVASVMYVAIAAFLINGALH